MAKKIGLASVADIVKENEKFTESIRKFAQDGLKKVWAEFFAKHPEVTAIQWEQYTPHFNDGDACEFSITGFEASTTPYDPEVGFEEADDMSAAVYSSLDEIESIPEDVFEIAFGNHVQVVITPDKSYVEEYEHE